MKPLNYCDKNFRPLLRVGTNGIPEFPHGYSEAKKYFQDSETNSTIVELALRYLEASLENERYEARIATLENKLKEYETDESSTEKEGSKEADQEDN